MRLMKFFTALFVIMFSINIFADEKKNDNSAADNSTKIKKIIILPFYNYTDSGKKYISTYLPELMKYNLLDEENDITVLDASDIKSEITDKKLDAASLSDTGAVRQFLKDMEADIGVRGRYLIHDKTIQIDFDIIYVSKDKVLPGMSYSGVIDHRLLSTLEKIAISRSAWIKSKVLGQSYLKIGIGKESLLARGKKWVKKSPYGRFLLNRWIYALIIIIIFYFLSKFVKILFEKVFKRIADRTETEVDEKILEIAKKPIKWIVLLIGVRIAAVSLELTGGFSLFLSHAIIGIIIILITYILMKSSSIMIESWGHKVADKIDSRIDDDLVPLFENITRIVIASIGILMVLSQFEIDIAPLIASLGIAGFAIGFAVKDSLSNIIGGIVLILDQSFAVGDKVTIDGDIGVIKEVGLRNTKLQTFDNEIIVIPNGELMNKKFKNYVLPDPKIRVIVNFGVSYGTDVEKVEKVVAEAIKEMEDICEDPAPVVVFTKMDDFALTMEAKFFVPEYVNQYGKWLEGTKIVYNTLVKEGINIPFPTHTVHLQKDE